MQFSEYLQNFLTKYNLSQSRFAKKIGCSHTTVNKWCQGISNPDMIRFFAIAYEIAEQRDESIEKVLTEIYLVSGMPKKSRGGRK